MIRHTTPRLNKHHIGIQRNNKSYTFLHWLDHNTATSRFKWLKYRSVLKEYDAVGPTMLVEWNDD